MTTETSPWPRRAAHAACLVTFPIFLIGGTVTSLRVGMSVPDWPTTFGQNMFTYPLDEMLENSGVSWEHSHRLYGALVGLVVFALLVVVWRFEKRASVRALAALAFAWVCVQGLLGGLRVTQNSPELAFLHGVSAQALFACIAGIMFLVSPAWWSAGPKVCKRAVPLSRAALLATGIVFVQTTIGAWLRHSGNRAALGLHIVLALVATWSVIALARELRLAAEEGVHGGHDRTILLVVRTWIVRFLAVQLTLGVLAAVWIFIVTGPQNPVSIGEAVFATAHVAVGALLLAACVGGVVFGRRVVVARDAERSGSLALEGVR